MDHPTRLSVFRSEAAAFDRALRRAADGGRDAPPVPSCPGWSVAGVEQAVHRWDAESVTGTPAPFDPAFAADAVAQTFGAVVPARRGRKPAPAGAGERYRFRRSDGPGSWTLEFTGDRVRLEPGGTGRVAVEAAGTACDLTLFLRQRLPAAGLEATGDPALLDRWSDLVPPV
ncbi:hypothetical protein ACIRBY_26420 [Streptomyces sp. NPDC096136]|uniref:hypothetical protein n=1 Tax=Streptomyces sp. NPDC096136 TaxID=3366076 RepID=UPI0037FD20C0